MVDESTTEGVVEASVEVCAAEGAGVVVRVGENDGAVVGAEVGAIQRVLLLALTRHESVASHGLLANNGAEPPDDPAE